MWFAVQQSDLAWLPTCGNAATLMAFGLCLVLHPKLTEVRCQLPPAMHPAWPAQFQHASVHAHRVGHCCSSVISRPQAHQPPCTSMLAPSHSYADMCLYHQLLCPIHAAW